jgi:glucokinase
MLLGIDLGGTKTAFALADDGGSLLRRETRPTALSGDARSDVTRIAEIARELIAGEGLSGIGISAPGPIDMDAGVLMQPPNLTGWGAVPIRDWLAEDLGCPVRLENDANAAALAEWRYGAGRGLTDLVYLTMSTGIGAGLIFNGQLVRGQDGTAGELGHAPVEWNGAPCACGLRGCLEAYIGGAAWSKRLRADAPEASAVLALAQGDRSRITPRELVAAAGQGDAYALTEMERFNDYLARAIVHIAFAFAPQAVLLGTIVAAAGETLCLGPVRERVARHVWPHQAPYMQILPAELGDDLPYLAGICAAREGQGAEG